jgi:hypothetical protein
VAAYRTESGILTEINFRILHSQQVPGTKPFFGCEEG